MLAFVAFEGLDGLHVDDLQLRAGPSAGVEVHEQAVAAGEAEDFAFAHRGGGLEEVVGEAGVEIVEFYCIYSELNIGERKRR